MHNLALPDLRGALFFLILCFLRKYWVGALLVHRETCGVTTFKKILEDISPFYGATVTSRKVAPPSVKNFRYREVLLRPPKVYLSWTKNEDKRWDDNTKLNYRLIIDTFCTKNRKKPSKFNGIDFLVQDSQKNSISKTPATILVQTWHFIFHKYRYHVLSNKIQRVICSWVTGSERRIYPHPPPFWRSSY